MSFQIGQAIGQKVRESLDTATHSTLALLSIPRKTYLFWRRGVMPLSYKALEILKNEGNEDIIYKLLGEMIAGYLQYSGPLFIKVGQILSTREDLLPKNLSKRLDVLYDKQPAMPERRVRDLITKQYGDKSPFKDFTTKPFAVGSIGQVHKATLKGGQSVVVKVKRQNIDGQVEQDVLFIKFLLKALELIVPQNYKESLNLISRFFQEISGNFKSELDFKLEARNLEEFGHRFQNNKKIKIPHCYLALSNENLLVMEEVVGTPLSKLRKVKGTTKKAAGTPSANPYEDLASLALQELLKQIFVHGHFHGDPHAGNLLVTPEGQLAFIDFGLAGTFTKQDRKTLKKALKAFLSKDPDKAMHALLEFGRLPSGFDHAAFKEAIVKVVEHHKSTQTKGEFQLEKFVNDLFKCAYRFDIDVPKDTVLFIKGLVTIEGVARSLDPKVNVKKVAMEVMFESVLSIWPFKKSR